MLLIDSLETYGFRGEALYALSSVSDLTIISKTEQDEVATSYTIDHYGRIINSEPCHRSTGNLFQISNCLKFAKYIYFARNHCTSEATV